MMTAWLDQAKEIALAVLGNPEILGDLFITGPMALIAFCLVMVFACSAAGMTSIGSVQCIVGGLVGVLILLVAVTATAIHLAPLVSDTGTQRAVTIGVPVLVILIVGIPAMSYVLRSKYVGTAIAFTASIVATFLIVQLTNSVLASVRGGGRQSNSLRGRTDAMNRMMEK